MEASGRVVMKQPIWETPIKARTMRASSDSPSTATTGAGSCSHSSVDQSPLSSSGECQPSTDEGFDAVRRLDFDDADPEAMDELPVGESRVYWEAFFVNMPMFCGYAALFGLQHEIKTKYGISDNDVDASRMFGVAVSLLYVFNLIFRFSHNVAFGFTGPRGRSYIAMLAMMGSMLVIVIAIFLMESRSMGWVMIAYALGGVAVGTFEGNFLCCLTPLGHRTKHIAITAIPVGITLVLVGGFFALGPPLNLSAAGIYTVVAVSVFCSTILFAWRIPHATSNEQAESQYGLRRLLFESRQWRQWLPRIWHLPLATMIDMFTLSSFSPGVALYIWDQKTVHIGTGVTLPTDTFFAIFNTFNMFGGLCGRILSYRINARHPLIYSLFSIVGALILLMKVPLLAPLSTFMVMMGDGLIYGSIARRIDEVVPTQFNLIAISFWLFVGDFGSVAGSNMISYMREWVMSS